MHLKELTTETARGVLTDGNKYSKLNYEGLFHLLDEKNIPIRFVEFRVNAVGVATFDCIFININYLHRPDIIYFVLLHEMAHYRRVKDKGFDWYVNRYLGNTLEVFISHVIEEELIADRYADTVGLFLNKENGNFHSFNQGLTNTSKVEKYKEHIEDLYYSLPKDYEEYVNFINENVVYSK